MRKINIFLFIVLLLSITVCAVYAYNKNIPADKIVEGTNASADKVFFDDSVQKVKQYVLRDNTTVNLEYKQSRNINSSEKTELVYTDPDGNEYVFDSNAVKLSKVMLIKKDGDKDISSAKVGQDIARSTAEGLAARYVDLGGYEFDRYNYANNYYSFIWVKKLNGVRTADYVFVDIDEYGRPMSVNMPNEGLLEEKGVTADQTDKTVISREKAIEIVENAVQKEYKDCDSKVDNTELYIDKSGRQTWVCSVTLSFKLSNNMSSSMIKTFFVDAENGKVTENKVQ